MRLFNKIISKKNTKKKFLSSERLYSKKHKKKILLKKIY
jgi:hypothetical protein